MIGSVALVSALAGLAAAAPVARDNTPVTYGNFSATYFWAGEYSGSCGYSNSTKQYIASVKKDSSLKESACGKTINITDYDTGKAVLAQVVDEADDVSKTYLNVSRVTFQNVTELKEEHFKASYVFVDAEVPVWTEPKSDDSDDKWTPAPSSKDDSPKPAPTSSEKHQEAEWTPSSSKKEAEWTPSSSKKEAQWTPSSSSKKAEWTPKSSSKKEAEWTPSSSSKKAEWTPKTTSSKKAEWTPKTTSSKKAEQTKPASNNNGGGGGGQFSGRATWYTQGGNAGACGSVNSDGAYIVAVNSAQYSGGSHCGQSVRISSGGKSITARVADLCPGCGYGSLDLSTGAFQALGSLGTGVLPISWSWA